MAVEDLCRFFSAFFRALLANKCLVASQDRTGRVQGDVGAYRPNASQACFLLDLGQETRQESHCGIWARSLPVRNEDANNKTKQNAFGFGVVIVLKIKLDKRKAIEAAAILASGSPEHKLNRKRLLALLYIANREWFQRTGRPLLGGRIAAMK